MVFITQQKQQLSIKQIILEAIKKIGELSALEFRGGYFERKFEGNNWIDVYIPDIRKQVIQSIDFIRILTTPKFDEQMKEEYEKFLKEQEENYKQNAEKDLEVYTINKLKLMLRLFESINLFFDRTEYFKAQSYEEKPEGDYKDE